MMHLNTWGSLGGLSLFIVFVGCGDETVNLGGGSAGQQVQRGARCRDSVIVSGSVRVSNQSEMEALAGCEEIEGALLVEFFSGADLHPLAALRVIGGQLVLGAERDYGDGVGYEEARRIEEEDARVVAEGYLPSLAGLEGLEEVAGLAISGIAAEDITPLASLRKLVGFGIDFPIGLVSISGSNLRNLQGLEGVQGVQHVALDGNAQLQSLAGLVLGEYPLDVAILDSPLLTALPELSDLLALRSLNLSNLGIANLDDLSSLLSVEGSFDLAENPNLVNIDRLAQVSMGSLSLQDNPALASVPSLAASTWLESFLAMYNPELTSIALDLPLHSAGFDRLQNETLVDPVRVIEIARNDKLTRVSLGAGLEQGRFVAIYENPALESIAIGTLTQLDELRILENPALDSVELGALEQVGSLSVRDNPSLDPVALRDIRTFDTIMVGNAGESFAAP